MTQILVQFWRNKTGGVDRKPGRLLPGPNLIYTDECRLFRRETSQWVRARRFRALREVPQVQSQRSSRFPCGLSGQTGAASTRDYAIQRLWKVPYLRHLSIVVRLLPRTEVRG